MAKERWLIDPGELDEFQRDIRDLAIDDSYAIKGCAGSGKTILALYRANDIYIEALAEGTAKPNFTMVVYTIALKEFIKAGIKQLGIPIQQIVHHEVWDGSEIDYIIVDEAQDFDKAKIEELNNASYKSIMFYGDSQQQLYLDSISIEEIASTLSLPLKELARNYRLPKQIASFASHLCDDKDLEKKCVKSGSEKPRIIKFTSWQQELDFIVNEIKTRNYTDVAILVPFNSKTSGKDNNLNHNVEIIHEYFDSIGFRHEYKRNYDNVMSFELDFESDNPKIMTFHSSKGLQFDTVFIPFCDYPAYDKWFIDRYKNPLYVAMTRASKYLYITHTSRLSPFLNDIPAIKYD